jgi:acetyl esterase/lipase
MDENRSVLTRAADPPDRIEAYGALPDQVADIRSGSAEAAHRPLLLLVHGGFWRPHIDRTHTGPMTMALAAAGWTVASLEYRRVPGAPDLTVQDLTVAVRTLPTRLAGYDGRLIVVGHSAGGHLALCLAALGPHPALCGVLALAPAADLELAHELDLGNGAVAAFLGASPETRQDLDPRRMRSPALATTIIHGAEDTVVPPSLSRSYATAHPRTRLILPGGVGHFALIDPESGAWPAVGAELERLASGGPR